MRTDTRDGWGQGWRVALTFYKYGRDRQKRRLSARVRSNNQYSLE